MLDWLYTEGTGVVVLAIMGIARIVGEVLIRLGKERDGVDWMDTTGDKILEWVNKIGKFLAFIGLGNSSARR